MLSNFTSVPRVSKFSPSDFKFSGGLDDEKFVIMMSSPSLLSRTTFFLSTDKNAVTPVLAECSLIFLAISVMSSEEIVAEMLMASWFLDSKSKLMVPVLLTKVNASR